jgi:NitT/TauT family transport system ATP-binding protein
MQTELLKIWEAARKSILFVTHSIEEAIFLSDRLAVLTRRPGQIMEIIEVDLPRPRQEELRSDERVIRLKRHIWGELKEAVAA